LGDGTKTNRFSPTQVLLGNGNIKKVDLGGSHTVILKNNGDVYGFGINTVNENFYSIKNSQLGIFSENPETNYNNGNRFIPTPPLNIYSGVRDICAGYEYSMILTQTGKVYTYGGNNVNLITLLI
jgi:alpha-tubulin suppressor-like RCC1 family protein